MSDGTYAYDYNTADSASGDIKQVISSIETTLDEMDGDMNKLAGGWDSTEHDEYKTIHGRWNKGAHQARTVLAQVRASLDENSNSVVETRQRASNAIAGE